MHRTSKDGGARRGPYRRRPSTSACDPDQREAGRQQRQGRTNPGKDALLAQPHPRRVMLERARGRKLLLKVPEVVETLGI